MFHMVHDLGHPRGNNKAGDLLSVSSHIADEFASVQYTKFDTAVPSIDNCNERVYLASVDI